MVDKSFSFNDETLYNLWGAEDAESERPERLKEYFVANQAYKNLRAELPIRIVVGYKGVGKSALMRRSYLDDLADNKLALWLRVDELSEATPAKDDDYLARISHWKSGLSEAIKNRVLDDYYSPTSSSENFFAGKGRLTNAITAILNEYSKLQEGDVKEAIAKNFLAEKQVVVYIDDLDRGWKARAVDVQNMDAFVNAVRDISVDHPSVRFKLAFRTDVYNLIRTKEFSDKVGRHVIFLDYTQHEILAIIAARVSTYFSLGYSTDDILKLKQPAISSKILSHVIDEEYYGRGRWDGYPTYKVLLSLIRHRPRDMIKLLYGASRKAHRNKSRVIGTVAIESEIPQYSNDRIQDLVNEFRTELPNIEELLYAMRPKWKKGAKYVDFFRFTDDELLSKLNNVQQRVNVLFSDRRQVNAKVLREFLYKINFIEARKLEKGGSKILRERYSSNPLLAKKETQFGWGWEIHPSFRAALEPDSVKKVLEVILDELT